MRARLAGCAGSLALLASVIPAQQDGDGLDAALAKLVRTDPWCGYAVAIAPLDGAIEVRVAAELNLVRTAADGVELECLPYPARLERIH